ncbi:glutamine amidotransferase-related protein [Alkalimarinus coralli]|uniref:glutamine amidotransferase-related protein n=1 Tax=Alkalimarinus coralli TaxID=2935863 RepID=UPI00202B026D|nr:GMP synthase [Alkalimarinus coralli]
MKQQLKLGILDCDILHESLRKEYASYAHMIQTLFMQVEPSINFAIYPVVEGVYPDDVDECDGYIITGSKSSAYDNDEWIGELRNYVRTLACQNKKMVGICFGHQLLAHVLGGRTQKSENGWGVGVKSSDVIDSPEWMEPKMKSYSLLVSHQDQVVQLPSEATVIASSEYCPNSAFQLGDNILGFQGHPEFIRGYSRKLMEMRRGIIPDDVIEQGMASLLESTDHLVVARWIVNFLQRS